MEVNELCNKTHELLQFMQERSDKDRDREKRARYSRSLSRSKERATKRMI